MDNKSLSTWERIKDSDVYHSFIKSPTANKYINNIPITNVGSETPSKEIAKTKSLKKPFRFIPV